MSDDFEQNRDFCANLLARFRQAPLGHFIGGKAFAGVSAEMLENLSPVDGESLGQVAAGGAEDVARACSAAQDAFDDWRRASGKARKKILHAIAGAITGRA
ncbi:MAG TPA: aldehyde dehydrogenase family protein, partial [Woeseiaceae bacterium]|nr:aldehyde dehydrogenase family protein [Woeseiaceae bacterium]